VNPLTHPGTPACSTQTVSIAPTATTLPTPLTPSFSTASLPAAPAATTLPKSLAPCLGPESLPAGYNHGRCTCSNFAHISILRGLLSFATTQSCSQAFLTRRWIPSGAENTRWENRRQNLHPSCNTAASALESTRQGLLLCV